MNEQDVLLGIFTSGNSANVIRAFERAKQLGGKTILSTLSITARLCQR